MRSLYKMLRATICQWDIPPKRWLIVLVYQGKIRMHLLYKAMNVQRKRSKKENSMMKLFQLKCQRDLWAKIIKSKKRHKHLKQMKGYVLEQQWMCLENCARHLMREEQ